jgi:single-stranded-DNA-specific exonuclease
MRWVNRSVDVKAVEGLARALGVPRLVAQVLVQRNLAEPDAAARFLNPDLSHLHDPFLMADMDAAVRRLRRALERSEKILIYADYDVDGTMAAAVLLTVLRALGARVDVFVPHRLTDGYGMRLPPVEKAAADGYKLILTVDTGIREHDVIARACELGVECIVTDHHLLASRLPPACAVLNPKRPDCRYPDKELSGVGVAFKLAQALLGTAMHARLVESYLKIVAIGTIADLVPLVGENRVMARLGLEALRRPAQVGLAALLKQAGLGGQPISAADVSFRIAPRLNAAGRMENATDVIELLTTQDAARAGQIAEHLERLNRERQQMEDRIVKEIVTRVAARPELAERYFLVFAGPGWHRGVIGIVAQRVVERYHRPALVVGIEDGQAQGSGRSIASFHLLEALSAVGDLFERYGGHAQAAGFAMPAERLGEMENRLEAYARTRLAPADLEPILRVDAELSLPELDWELYEGLRKLEPFGYGNPTPVFVARNLRLLAPPRILQERHLKLKVAGGGRTFDALWWNRAERASPLAPGQLVDVAFTLDSNVFQGAISLQLILRDLQPLDSES